MKCVFCGKRVDIGDKIGRNDTCQHCGMDLRCCKQCRFHDPGAYNDCREVMAERIVDKERANFCDYFAPIGESGQRLNKTVKAKKALDALFK
ncbi:MAG: hypothetical protein GY864_00205 [Desulfobacterales bacterium]|nr:hypothetical protein [Desulfobacterales bacterium]